METLMHSGRRRWTTSQAGLHLLSKPHGARCLNLWPYASPLLWLAVDGDHNSTPKTKVVLKANLGIRHLARPCLPPQLPCEFAALRHPCRPDGVPLRLQSAARVDDPLPAVRVVTLLNQLVPTPHRGQPEGLVRDQLIRREAVVQLHHLDVVRGEPALVEGFRGSSLGHPESHHVDAGVGLLLRESRREVCLHGLREDLDCLALQPVLLHKPLAAYDHRRRSVGGGRAHQFLKRLVDHRRGLDVLHRGPRAELRVRVVQRVLVVLRGNHGQVLVGRSVELLVLAPRVPEHLGHEGGRLILMCRHHGPQVVVQEARPRLLDPTQGTGFHDLKPEGKGTVVHSPGDQLTAEEEGVRARRTGVRDVVDWNAGHTELVQHALTLARGVADGAQHSRLNSMVPQTAVLQRPLNRHLPVLRVLGALRVVLLLRLAEARHPHPNNEDAVRVGPSHSNGGCVWCV
eukprot:Sspe_Gene.53027::Locus_29340_Transcript_1_1_Confidence_1.000_Length_1426::g.53027::m.53027